MAREVIVTPAVMVTDQEDEQLPASARQADALGFIVKDASLRILTELPQRVREAVTRHRR
jgi:hypothetical protein